MTQPWEHWIPTSSKAPPKPSNPETRKPFHRSTRVPKLSSSKPNISDNNDNKSETPQPSNEPTNPTTIETSTEPKPDPYSLIRLWPRKHLSSTQKPKASKYTPIL